MTTQINLKFQDDFYEIAKSYADANGYMSFQELVWESLRDKIFENLEISESYKKVLQSEEANTFLSKEESKNFYKELKKKAGLK